MNIGTLTFHRACNYGGALQCFALIKALKQLGYNAEVVDYRSPAIEYAYKRIRTNNIKSFLSSILHYRDNKKIKQNFRTFQEKYIPTSSTIFKIGEDLSEKYDLVFIGSDQIWSKRINRGFDPIFWGNFRGKKATYAASMGTDHDFTKEEYSEIRRFLKNFNFLSTREESLKNEISLLTNKHIQTVIDPTLLLSWEDYNEIAIKPKEDNYVLYYQMEYHPQSKYFVANIAKQLGCKVITLMGPNEEYEGIKHIHKTVPQVNVQEFVGYILNAKCVVASSFHGTALPIAMRKNFYFLANYEADRAENLLRHIGALDRMKKSNENIVYTNVNYEQIEQKLNHFIANSKQYINECIQ